jgi:cytochrome c oxidase cbb3-type subunit 3
MSKIERDEHSGTETTGHEWDGIKELNTPLPRWWLWTFYACIIWAFGYMVLYPSVPGITGAFSGVLGYSSRANLTEQVTGARESQSIFLDQIAATDVQGIVDNQELARFARAGGESLFKVNCSQCHGSGAAGSEGYPNLNDDEWIWGGTPDAIYTTIAHGVRYEDDPETRFNEMPLFGEILSRDESRAVAEYAAFLGGLEGGQDTTEGAQLFADNCVACHGEGGQGDAEQGAPALSNAIWLYSGDSAAILQQVRNPRHGVMPAWLARLDDTSVKQLAVYVHSLGGGQ